MKQIEQIIAAESPGIKLESFGAVYEIHKRSKVRQWALVLLLLLIILLFLPWTQNIRSRGTVTSMRQEARPQEMNAIISGRIVKWYVQEGQMVNAGDTIVQLAEVKDAYLDPKLLERTGDQIEAKESAVEAYNTKAAASGAQIQALEAGQQLKQAQLENKTRQTTLKLRGDSMDMIAANNDYAIAQAQFRRQQTLRDSGLSSLQSVESKNAYLQNALAKKTSAEIKFTNTKTELLAIRIEQSSAIQEYAEKVSKAQGDRAAAQSEVAAGQGEIAKLNNQYSNYAIRAGQYYLIAPQRGQIVAAQNQGINEIIKEGESICRIVPQKGGSAVELFVKPMDATLISLEQEVRFQFDGYPAVVFSGWPEASSGLFDGKVVAVESATNADGLFRVLVAEDSTRKPWPPTLHLGTGAQAIALLDTVPIWYEVWRNINGFPPDFYKPASNSNDKKASAKK